MGHIHNLASKKEAKQWEQLDLLVGELTRCGWRLRFCCTKHNHPYHGMARYATSASRHVSQPDVVILIAFFAKGGIGEGVSAQRLVALHNEAVGADVCSTNR